MKQTRNALYYNRETYMLDKLFRNKIFIALYTPLLFVLACAVTIHNREIDGAILFAYIASATLLLSSRLTDAMQPAMLLCVFVTRCYDSSEAFFAKIPYLIPVVLAIILHFVIYAKRLKFGIGQSFFGLCGVTLAVTLGGLGTISSAEYFAGGARVYVFGLGIGMVLFYLLVKANTDEGSARDVLRVMYVTGLFACFCVLRFYAADWETVMETHRLVEFQSSNNLATFLMIAMPVPLFYASRRYVDILSVVLIYICTFLTGSRGGLLMGTIEFVLIFLAFAFYEKRIFNRILYALIAVAFIWTVYEYLPDLAEFYGIQLGSAADGTNNLAYYIEKLKGFFVRDGEARVVLLDRMFKDFDTNPLFGVGIGYTGNSDAYNPVKGAMNWYHMWFAQVIGGLGVLGILAYGYQLVERIVIFFRNQSLLHFTFLMSYLGLFLMSQVNPGEFCPMPYAALAMTFFALMEKGTLRFSEMGGKRKGQKVR